jgi:hypothetical protein
MCAIAKWLLSILRGGLRAMCHLKFHHLMIPIAAAPKTKTFVKPLEEQSDDRTR